MKGGEFAHMEGHSSAEMSVFFNWKGMNLPIWKGSKRGKSCTSHKSRGGGWIVGINWLEEQDHMKCGGFCHVFKANPGRKWCWALSTGGKCHGFWGGRVGKKILAFLQCLIKGDPFDWETKLELNWISFWCGWCNQAMRKVINSMLIVGERSKLGQV